MELNVQTNTVHDHIQEGTSDQEKEIRRTISHEAKEAKAKEAKAKEAKARVEEARVDLHAKLKDAVSALLILARASVPPASRRLSTQDRSRRRTALHSH